MRQNNFPKTFVSATNISLRASPRANRREKRAFVPVMNALAQIIYVHMYLPLESDAMRRNATRRGRPWRYVSRKRAHTNLLRSKLLQTPTPRTAVDADKDKLEPGINLSLKSI